MRIEQANSVQQFSALNAFKSNRVMKPAEEASTELIDDNISPTKTAPKGLLEKVDVSDIKKCAESVGEYNLSDEDIKYGLIYGRSVIAEWLC